MARSRRPKAGADERQERFECLYRANYGRVLAYTLRRSAPEVAHDVVAETFLVAWRRLDRISAEPLPLLLGVARKTLATHRRSEQRRISLLRQLEAHDAVRVQVGTGVVDNEDAFRVADASACRRRQRSTSPAPRPGR
jgi:DNA-directed RNA polymerase specialized sigma24 family protein